MNQGEKLVENTIRALQGKLTESSTVDYYRDKLKDIKNNYDELRKQGISRSDYRYKSNMQSEKDCILYLKQAIANEKGTFVKPIQITNILKKSEEFTTYKDSTSSVKGFHTNGRGDFKINQDMFKSSLDENDLFYEIEFFGKDVDSKKEKAKKVLEKEGFDIKKGSMSDSLYVSCYKK